MGWTRRYSLSLCVCVSLSVCVSPASVQPFDRLWKEKAAFLFPTCRVSLSVFAVFGHELEKPASRTALLA